MRRRRALKMLGASAASLTLIMSPAAAEREEAQPIQGELPNENVPHEPVFAFPATESTIEVGRFLQLRNGWVFPECTREEIIEFFDRTRQTFVFDGQTFVFDTFEDWEPYEVENGRFLFTHTDPPKMRGTTFQVTWDTVYTADFDTQCFDDRYEEGDRHAGFPFKSSYETVRKETGR